MAISIKFYALFFFSFDVTKQFVIDNTFFSFSLYYYCCSRVYTANIVPRKVLLESFDVPIDLDEQNQQESEYENELDEDDGHYKEAIPPAPKLQGTIPRSDSNTTQTIATKSSTTTSGDANNPDSVHNQRSFSEGKHLNEILKGINSEKFTVCLDD